MEKLKISLPIIVEGRYDKSALSGYVDAVIITTGGFGIFNNKEKQAMLRRICSGGVILLTDSDGGGIQIRSFLQGIIPKDKIYNLYIPKISGKEKRKAHPSKAGLLGVEGMDRETIERLLSPFSSGEEVNKSRELTTKLDFFEDGLSGGSNASVLRAKLCQALLLPTDMTAKALLEAVNLLIDREEYKRLISKIKTENNF
jgi:ribonuclease M5